MTISSPFSQWFMQRFSSPTDLCAYYHADIESKAREMGAQVPKDLYGQLDFGNGKGRSPRQYTYLPNLNGHRDCKQSCFAFLGITGEDAQNSGVPIPIIGFKSFKRPGEVYWSPQQALWRDFRANKGITESPTRRQEQSQYIENIKTLEHEAELAQKKFETNLAKAHAAAAVLAQVQLGRNYARVVNDPGQWLHNHGNPIIGFQPRPGGEYECIRPARGLVYSKTRNKWDSRLIASPRDLIVPVYSASGKISTFQTISMGRFPKKKFIPGSETVGCFTFITRQTHPSIFVMAEGYKTTRVIDHANSFIEPGSEPHFTSIWGLSATNFKNVAKLLHRSYPEALICFAHDNDDDGRYYANDAIDSIGDRGVIIPPPQISKGSDWADLCLHQTLDATADQFLSVLQSSIG